MIESINQRLAKLTPRNNFKSGGMGLDFPIHKSYTPLHGAAAVGGWVEIGRTTNGSELDDIDFQECNMSIGTTLAFFTNHDFDEGIESCKLIDDDDSQRFCSEGLRLEIKDSDMYEINPLNQEIREKYQPQFIEGTSEIIDIRSPAIISDFEFIPQTGMISFSIDRPQYVIMYIPNEFVTSQMLVTINGQIPNELDGENNILGKEISMIRFVPDDSGLVMIMPLPEQ